MHSDFFLNHDEVNSEETIGAAISDLFREKPSSRKALQECVATGSRALTERDVGREEAEDSGLEAFCLTRKRKQHFHRRKQEDLEVAHISLWINSESPPRATYLELIGLLFLASW